jgi:hypothetical protein
MTQTGVEKHEPREAVGPVAQPAAQSLEALAEAVRGSKMIVVTDESRLGWWQQVSHALEEAVKKMAEAD